VTLRNLLFVAPLLLAACTDLGQPQGPGTFTATLRSPNGLEGAAVVLLVGEGVLGVDPGGDTEAYTVTSGGTTRIVLINKSGGTLAFDVAMADLSRPPLALVREVAGPDDELRTDLAQYRVEFSLEPGR
jgi:hypothetical protein